MGEGRSAEAAPAPDSAAGDEGRVPARPVAGLIRPGRHRRRAVVADSRDPNRHLRTTWHRADGVFVVSTWTGDVCTGSVRVPVEQVPEVISLLSEGLGEAAASSPVATNRGRERRAEQPAPGIVDRALARLGLRRVATRKRSAKPSTNATILKLR